VFPKNSIFVFVLQCDPKHKQQIKRAEKKRRKRTGRLQRSRGTGRKKERKKNSTS